MICGNGEYLWVKEPAGAAPLPGREQPRNEDSWSSAGVSLEVGRLLEKGCVGRSANSASPPPPKHSAAPGVSCSLLSSDEGDLCMQWKYIH